MTDQAKKMNLYEYLTIFEKNLSVCKCCGQPYQCHFQRVCHHGSFFQNTLTSVLSDQLKKITLAQVFQGDNA